MSKVLRRPCTGSAVWRGPGLADSEEWILRLSPAQIGELDAALCTVRERSLPLLRVSAGDFPLPTLAGELERIADVLENGRGFVLIKGIPVKRYSQAATSTIFWGLGRHLGIPVSQNAAGHMLGHVRDTGRTMADPATRGYQTRARLPFHTDGSDVLGLLCLRAARSGARVTVASSAAVYNAVLARRPELVERLYRTHFLDRREEQAPGEQPYSAVPLACWYGGKLSVRYNRCYLESAQRFPNVPPLEPTDMELFDLIDELADSPEIRLDLDFEAGDLLLLNNHAVLHSRTEYEDFAEPERQRHVLRLWLALCHGRELPPDFWGNLRSKGGRPGRGGITPRDVIAT
ncbi:TauD/TfdA family dioxygenase [Streptomyces malaysiensis subsp. malaysiensis]|uniref:TauD/TfdA family dioxygenase n=1 Tax=Streptomyces malaysiensis TaxID=92644 RepID=UPI0024BFC082|nr:TauD/TfdA family dioxygenase [Streptomyces sp. NA07423]WHX15651.1 TauD/TfdA family dioxygenase [Streptomyces sp. NA07423]